MESNVQNKAKQWQIILFPFNNAATNIYLTLMSFVSYYAGYYLSGNFLIGFASAAVSAAITVTISTIITTMRIFDGITDPICGAIMDKTNTKFGKFRVFMVIGNLLLAISCILMFFVIRPIQSSVFRWIAFIVTYVIYVIGYTCQCACTKAGQTCLTSDAKQRSQFVIWNMVGMVMSIVMINLLGNGLLPILLKSDEGTLGVLYNPKFYDILVPIAIVLSAIYTLLSVLAIWEKDKPQYWGIDASQGKTKFKDYVKVVKDNKPIRWLVVSSGCNKLASTIATSNVVAALIYHVMMGNYNALYIPLYALSFIFMGIFFLLGSKTAARKGQKRAIVQYTLIAFIFYIGLTIMLLIWNPNNANTHLSLITGGAISINVFTVIWIILYGCGYGAYNCCSEMCIPMIADCSDYETYRSGQYVPGILGTIFSLIDKVVSSLSTTFLSLFTVLLIPGLNGAQPTPNMDLTAIIKSNYQGVRISALICFCFLPMISWLITLSCMKKYSLSGEKLREVQAVNSVRKAAISLGMPKEEAMETWKTIDQVPKKYIPEEPKISQNKFFDKVDEVYERIWEKEKNINEESINAIDIPSKYIENGENRL